MNLNHLNKIVDQLVSETDIDYGTETVFAPTLLPSHPFSLFLFPPSSFLYSFLFFDHCRHMYGLTEKETIYVWKQYKSIIEDKIKNKSLNESHFDDINNPQQHKFFNRIADDLMDSIEEIINIQHDDEPLELLLNMGNADLPYEGFYLHTPGGSYPEYLNQNKDADDFTYEIFKKIMDNYTMDILNTIQNKWGLDRMDGLFIIVYFFLPRLWNKYYKQDKPSQPLIYSPSPLNESHYTPKYYSPKWGVRRENDVLDRIVDGLVEESRIEYVEEIVHLANFSFQLFKGPFADLYSIPETSPFYQHCMDVYGLTPEEITYVWTEYRNIVRKEMQSSPLSNLISPFNESVEDNFLDKVIDQLVNETDIDYRTQVIVAPFFSKRFINPSLTLTSPFARHCRKIYGLTYNEIDYIWDQYKSIISDKIKNKPLNESIDKQDYYLDDVINKIVDESGLDSSGMVNIPFCDPFTKCWLPFSNPNAPTGFSHHCKKIYGLTDDEIQYVWDQYRMIANNKLLKESVND
jgi:hypothetical protein